LRRSNDPVTIAFCAVAPIPGRLVAGILAALVLVACQSSVAPPATPVQIGLQGGDLPGNLRRCQASGDVDGYLAFLQANGPQAHDELAAARKDLRAHGGEQAAVAVYTAQPPACAARLGTGAGTSVSSIVVRFRDDGSAESAYRRGLLGFSTPSEDQEVAGMERGAATGLGQNAWVLDRAIAGRTLIVAYWQHGAVTVLYLAVDADPLHAKQAIGMIDGRIR
jgi:hypothetical protein